ncbi:HAD family phosphatase [Actinomadura miaoliensis]|uniref:HAD family phosphatase n=1 Tax=Actinomadura miaoliensis TaxID=430685 RepID=A0ABP7W4M1_9ACTN
MTGPGLTIAGLPGVRAAIFDFNGTITDDETLQYEVYAEILAEHLGVVLERDTYFTDLAGRSDPAIVTAVLERCDPAPAGPARDALAARIIEARVRRYAERVRDAPPVRPGAAALIRALAGRVPLAVGTGAFRAEVDLVLSAAGLAGAFDAIVTVEDVRAGKPDPETFLRALDLLSRQAPTPSGRGPALRPADVVVFEDSPFGIEAARAAGMRCVAAHLTSEAGAEAAGAVVGALGPELLAGP